MRIEEPPEPWRSFFAEVDSRLREDVCLHCCGGFVVTQLYGVARTTSDVDFLGVVPNVRREPGGLTGRRAPIRKTRPYYGVWLTGALEPELAVVAGPGVAVEAFIAPALEASKVRGLNSRT